jgi:hypothetical protein
MKESDGGKQLNTTCMPYHIWSVEAIFILEVAIGTSPPLVKDGTTHKVIQEITQKVITL